MSRKKENTTTKENITNDIKKADAVRLSYDDIINNNLIEQTLTDRATQQGIDLYNCSLNPWKALLQEVGALLFADRDILKKPHPINKNLNNIYDLYKINKITDIYLYLSKKYNKLVSVLSLSLLLNMNCTGLFNLLNNNNHLYSSAEFNTLRNDLYKKIYISREENIKDKCFEVSSPVGVIALANNEFGWNTGGQNNSITDQQTKPLNSLPSLQDIKALKG